MLDIDESVILIEYSYLIIDIHKLWSDPFQPGKSIVRIIIHNASCRNEKKISWRSQFELWKTNKIEYRPVVPFY